MRSRKVRVFVSTFNMDGQVSALVFYARGLVIYTVRWLHAILLGLLFFANVPGSANGCSGIFSSI